MYRYVQRDMGFYNNAGGLVQTPTRIELIQEIKLRLDKGQTNLNDIDVSRVTDMSFLFQLFRKYDLSKLDISLWDVSNVRDMRCMFFHCKSFNSDLSHWDVSSVESMNSMFANCSNFNSDISKWNVSKVDNMAYMFADCTNFNCDLSDWNTKSLIFNSEIFFNSGIKEKPKWVSIRLQVD